MNDRRSVWSWLSNAKNQKTLAFVGVGLSVAIGGAWQVYLHLSEKPKESSEVQVAVIPTTTIEQATKGDGSAAVIAIIPLDHKNIAQKTEGKNSPAIISNGDVSLKED